MVLYEKELKSAVSKALLDLYSVTVSPEDILLQETRKEFLHIKSLWLRLQPKTWYQRRVSQCGTGGARGTPAQCNGMSGTLNYKS